MVVPATDNADYKNWNYNQGEKTEEIMPQKQEKSKGVSRSKRSNKGKSTTTPTKPTTDQFPGKTLQNKKWNASPSKDANQIPQDLANGKDTSSEKKKKTPYQGPYRTCGMFHCLKCKREWFSANSWANCYQKCNGCNNKIYPYKQFRPWGGSGPRDGAPSHPISMCQKCQQLGHTCVKKSIDTVEREEETLSDTERQGFEREE